MAASIVSSPRWQAVRYRAGHHRSGHGVPDACRQSSAFPAVSLLGVLHSGTRKPAAFLPGVALLMSLNKWGRS